MPQQTVSVRHAKAHFSALVTQDAGPPGTGWPRLMCLDSAILIKLVVLEPDSFYYADCVDGQADLCSRQVALTEVWSALLRKEREGALDSGLQPITCACRSCRCRTVLGSLGQSLRRARRRPSAGQPRLPLRVHGSQVLVQPLEVARQALGFDMLAPPVVGRDAFREAVALGLRGLDRSLQAGDAFGPDARRVREALRLGALAALALSFTIGSLPCGRMAAGLAVVGHRPVAAMGWSGRSRANACRTARSLAANCRVVGNCGWSLASL
jgi:hypothetical protein